MLIGMPTTLSSYLQVNYHIIAVVYFIRGNVLHIAKFLIIITPKISKFYYGHNR